MDSNPSKWLSLSWLLLMGVSVSSGFHPWSMRGMDIPVPRSDAEPVAASAIWQKLDHYNTSDPRTLKQRYFKNDQYYKPGGPVFLYIGGESKVYPEILQGGHMVELAAKYNATTFMLEHRYYGDSLPTELDKMEYFTFLTSQQALTDLAYFISYIKRVHTELEKAKVIVFGGSYPGNLAAWMRLKYPDLVYGAVASSAPVQAQMDFPEYWETIGESLKKHDPQCEAAIRNATTELKPIMHYASIIFRETSLKLRQTYTSLAGIFSVTVQNQYMNIRAACRAMTTGEGSPLDRYLAKRSSNLKYSMSESDSHSWSYQFCNEFGYLQTFSKKQPFGEGDQLQDRIATCQQKFGFDGARIAASVQQTNDYYGGRNLDVKRVVFVNGDLDPWHKLGVTSDLNSESPAILIEGTSHCSDMTSYSVDDPQSLIDARERIGAEVEKWVEAA